MDIEKSVYLVSKAIQIQPQGPELFYDEISDLNLVESGEAYCNIKGLASTHSKTDSLPGDDDPDPGKMQCY
jgi:hypothetical protein